LERKGLTVDDGGSAMVRRRVPAVSGDERVQRKVAEHP
jgi:hypothetical protein